MTLRHVLTGHRLRRQVNREAADTQLCIRQTEPDVDTVIKTTSVCDASSVGGGRGWLAGDTDWLAGWPVTVRVVEVGVSANQQQILSGTGARVYTAHRGWLGVVTGVSAASTGGVLVVYNAHNGQQKLNLRRKTEGVKRTERPAGNTES